ncbi:cobalamin/Fe(3+)-siderophore ABC transporter ATP-binding protein, partial [Pectobacterium brasiliense]|nr:cobalamin/Fe(3+)-siderophore ABC transporter ATP-binding protein [Pectobacterium brasiliense]
MPENVQPTRIPPTDREAIASQSLTLSYEKQVVIDALDIT